MPIPRTSLLALALAAGSVLPSAAGAQAATGGGEGAPGRYIVVYDASVQDPDAATSRREQAQGFSARRRYRHALKGFAASLSDAQVRRLRSDPAVDAVVSDRPVRATAFTPLLSGDQAPTGVRRIEAATTTMAREASSARVAVIDTGIDLGHSDLNVSGGTDCVDGDTTPQDGNGHGTHVAGTIGARNNGAGVVGVAPGTPLAAVRVLGDDGSGLTSDVVCGINWVVGTHRDGDPANDIAIANMSLGGLGPSPSPCASTTDPEHRAICAATAEGILVVAAAGNVATAYDRLHTDTGKACSSPSSTCGVDVPASYPELLTVTAMSDNDGLPGPPTLDSVCDDDEYYASYSNFASSAASSAAGHTIAAPGSCIRSTYPTGLDTADGNADGYTLSSGTSMAAPHVSGSVALCLGEAGARGRCAGETPARIVERMRAEAQQRTARESLYGFRGDPSDPVTAVGDDVEIYFGYLVAPDTRSPSVTLTSPAHGSTTTDTTPTFAGAAGAEDGDGETIQVDVFAGSAATGSPVRTLRATRSGGSWSVSPDDAAALADGVYTARASQSDADGNTAVTGPSTFTVEISQPAQTQQAPSSTSPEPAPTQQSAPAPAPADTPAATALAKFPAKLQVARSRVLRSERRLDVVAPITKRASGSVRVSFNAAGRTTRFTQRIDEQRGEIRINRRIPAAQARLGTGIVTIEYGGDADTRGQVVRLRAASRKALLDPVRPRIADGRLKASGTISSRARGVVRIQLDWEQDGRSAVHEVTARIRNGRFRFDEPLPSGVRQGIAARTGTLHSYVLFTGYQRAGMRGEMRSFQVLGER